MLDRLKPPKGSIKKKKRVGRGHGSGHGKTSGKGHKGQSARSGGNIKPGFEGGQMPLQRRLPKRGFTNIFAVRNRTVNIGDIAGKFSSGETADPGTILERGPPPGGRRCSASGRRKRRGRGRKSGGNIVGGLDFQYKQGPRPKPQNHN